MTDPINDILNEDLPEDLRQIAEIIGLDKLLELSARMGGDRIHIPLPEKLAVAARNRAIRSAFNGRNYRDLAIQYGLTVRWIRAIVSGETAAGRRADADESVYKQIKMF